MTSGTNFANESNIKKATDKKLKIKSLEKPDLENSNDTVMKENEKKKKIEVKIEKKKQTEISNVRKAPSKFHFLCFILFQSCDLLMFNSFLQVLKSKS